MISGHEALDLEKREPSVAIARFPDSGCSDDLDILGRLVGLPEAYWAAIAAVVVMQSPIGDTVPLAIERIVASALGASVGAIESTYFGVNLFAFGLAMLLLGMISFVLRLEKVGYSYACITLMIIAMIPRAEAPWIAAAHRFAEVSLGILVALAIVAVWREERRFFENATAK
jgi:uncharacterized membrane protein YgaE (UPF0421/DUF939 family)